MNIAPYIASMTGQVSTTVKGYGFAVLAFIAALAVRGWVSDALPPGFPFLTFFPAVIMTAYLHGTRPGVLCAALSTLAAWYFFIPPFNTFTLDGPTGLALGFFICVAGVDILIIHLMQTSRERERAERQRNAELLAHQKTLFAELQHRVANNLALVANLLTVESFKLRDTPGAAEALVSARGRLETMAHIHRKLYDPDTINVPLEEFIREISGDILAANSAAHVTCDIDVPKIALAPDNIMTLTLIIVESITNSLKHAFAAGQVGRILIRLHQEGEDYRLTIEDNGPGPVEIVPRTGVSASLGLRIIESFAASLGGRIQFGGGQGMRTELVFPAHRI